MAEPIYHICTWDEWHIAERDGAYGGSSQDQADGFIHFSGGAQLIETAAKHRAGQTNLVLLSVDPDKLGPALKWEKSRGDMLFPHLYGKLPVAAVISARDLPLGPDGLHIFTVHPHPSLPLRGRVREGDAPHRMPPNSLYERAARKQGYALIAGVDEVGRGPWAGPVYAAAAILDTRKIAACGLAGLDDSKKLSAAAREALSLRIVEHCSVGIGWAEVDEIDHINILQASLLAMSRAVAALPIVPDYCLVDGNKAPKLSCAVETIVEGDARSYSIAAASIVAKVTRDRLMCALAEECPGYGWERNKGYGTAEHRGAIDRLGLTAHHRKSWAPIVNRLSQLSLDLQDVAPVDSL